MTVERGGLEVGVDKRRRLLTAHTAHVSDVPDLLEEGRQLPVLELEGYAHVRVLHPERSQLGEDREDLPEHDAAARGAAMLVQNVNSQRRQIVTLDLLH